MDDVVAKLYEKLDAAIKRLRDGNHDDHDFLPGLLWALLEYNRSHSGELRQLLDRSEMALSVIETVPRSLEGVCEKLQHNTTDGLEKTAAEAKTIIGNLALAVKEESERLRHELARIGETSAADLSSSKDDLKQMIRQSTVQLQKLVETKLDGQFEAHQSGLCRTDNKVNWILIASISQIILILIVIFQVFGK